MEPSPLVFDVERVLEVMYTGSGEDRQQAIAWLARFSTSPLSWDVYPALLSSKSSRAQFYGATGVYNTVVAYWHALSEQQRSGLTAFLWGALADAGRLDAPVRRKLSSALAVVAVLNAGRDSLSTVVLRVSSFADSGVVSSLGTVLLHVELLEALADEADRLPMSLSKTDKVRADLTACVPAVLGALSWAASSPASPINENAASRERFLGAVLTCTKSWVRYGASLGSCWRAFPGLLRAAVEALALDPPTASQAWIATSVAAAELLEALVESRRYPREQERSPALSALVEAIVALNASCGVRTPPHGLYSLALVVNSIVTIEDSWCAIAAAAEPHRLGLTAFMCPFLFAESDQAVAAEAAGVPLDAVARQLPLSHVTAGGAVAGIGVLLGDLLLQLCASPDLRVAQECLSGAMAVQALDSSPRHPFFRRPFFRQLVQLVVHQCASVELQQGPLSEPLAEYRGMRSPLRDALPDAAAQLREEFLDVLCRWLSTGVARRVVADGCGRQGVLKPPPPDARLEAVLFCLDVASPTLVDLLGEADADECGGSPPTHCATAVPDGSLEESIAALVELVASDAALTGISSRPRLAASACSWLGGLSRWLGTKKAGASVRCATGLGGSASSPGASPAPLEASFRLLSVAHLVRLAVRFVLTALNHARSAIGAGGADVDTRGDTLDRIATLVGSHQGGGEGAAGSADGDASVESYAEDSETSTDLLARKASSALAHLCGVCSRHLVDGGAEIVTALCSALYSDSRTALPVSLRSKLLTSCVSICAVLPGTARDQALRFTLQPLLADLLGAVQAATLAQSSALAADGLSFRVASCCALLVAALDVPAAVTGERGGVLDSVVDTALPPLEQVAFLFSTKPAVVGCALVALQSLLSASLRARRNVVQLATLLQLSIAVFQRQLAADALVLSNKVLDALIACASPSSAPSSSASSAHDTASIVAAASSAMTAIADTVCRAAGVDESGRHVAVHGSSILAHLPDTILEFARLCRGLVDLCPVVFVSPRVAEACVLLSAMSLHSTLPDVARSGAALFRVLTTRQDLRAEPKVLAAVDAAVASCGKRNPDRLCVIKYFFVECRVGSCCCHHPWLYGGVLPYVGCFSCRSAWCITRDLPRKHGECECCASRLRRTACRCRLTFLGVARRPYCCLRCKSPGSQNCCCLSFSSGRRSGCRSAYRFSKSHIGRCACSG